jgi:hypothetical protein
MQVLGDVKQRIFSMVVSNAVARNLFPQAVFIAVGDSSAGGRRVNSLSLRTELSR